MQNTPIPKMASARSGWVRTPSTTAASPIRAAIGTSHRSTVRIVSRIDTSSTGSVTAGSSATAWLRTMLTICGPVICTGPPAPTTRAWASATMSARNSAACGLPASRPMLSTSSFSGIPSVGGRRRGDDCRQLGADLGVLEDLAGDRPAARRVERDALQPPAAGGEGEQDGGDEEQQAGESAAHPAKSGKDRRRRRIGDSTRRRTVTLVGDRAPTREHVRHCRRCCGAAPVGGARGAAGAAPSSPVGSPSRTAAGRADSVGNAATRASSSER